VKPTSSPKAINDPAWQDLIARQGKTWEGLWNRVTGQIKNMSLGSGGTVIDYLEAQLDHFAVWLKDNRAEIEETATEFAKKIVTGFEAAKSAFKWIVDQKVKGIGRKTYAKLKPYLAIAGQTTLKD